MLMKRALQFATLLLGLTLASSSYSQFQENQEDQTPYSGDYAEGTTSPEGEGTGGDEETGSTTGIPDSINGPSVEVMDAVMEDPSWGYETEGDSFADPGDDTGSDTGAGEFDTWDEETGDESGFPDVPPDVIINPDEIQEPPQPPLE